MTPGQALHLAIAGHDGGLAQQAVELGDGGVDQGGGVADQLVHHVGLGGVQGPAVVADVLGAQEGLLAQVAHEGAGADQAGDGLHAEAAGGLQAGVEALELGDPPAVQGQELLQLQDLPADPLGVDGQQLADDAAPDGVLVVGIRSLGHGLAGAVLQGDAGDLVAAGPVGGVAKARVVGVEGDEFPGAAGVSPGRRAEVHGGRVGTGVVRGEGDLRVARGPLVVEAALDHRQAGRWRPDRARSKARGAPKTHNAAPGTASWVAGKAGCSENA